MLGPGQSNAVLAQHFVLGGLPDQINHFGFPTKEAFVLRTDAAFAAMGAWDARSEVAGRLAEQPGQLGASKPVVVQECWLQG